MPRITLSLVVFFYLFSITTYGQSTLHLTGATRDSIGYPVPYASIVVYNSCNQQVSAYGASDGNGQVRISFDNTQNCDSFRISIRALGYHSLDFKWLAADSERPIQWLLSQNALKEITISAQAPAISVRSDTTEFRVASFSDSTEISVEELLKKLPGVQIDASGLIKYKGKTVERVLIEGDDLFSQNYTLATRNLRADILDRVQAIDQYQENPLQKGISDSDRLVLNLTIKAEKKRQQSGSFQTGLGAGDGIKGNAHLNFFSLSKRDKTYAIANANNIAEQNFGAIKMINAGDLRDQGRRSIQNDPLKKEQLLTQPFLQNLGLPPAFTQNNKGALAYLGEVLPIGTRGKIKASGWLGAEKNTQKTDNESVFQSDALFFDLKEKSEVKNRGNYWHFQTEASYSSKNGRQSYRLFAKTDGLLTKTDKSVGRTSNLTPSLEIRENKTIRSSEGFAALEFTHKTLRNKLWQILAKISTAHTPQQLRAVSPQYAAYFDKDDAYQHLQQSSGNRQYKIICSAQHFFKLNKLKLRFELNAESDQGNIQSALDLTTSEGKQPVSIPFFGNQLSARTNQVNLRLGGSYRKGALLLQSWLQPGIVHLRHRQTTNTFQNHKLSSLLEAGGAVTHEFSQYTRLNISSQFRTETPAFQDLFASYYFQDYQTIRRSVPDFAIMPRYKNQVLFQHESPNALSGINASFYHDLSSNILGTGSLVDPYLFVQQQFRPAKHASILGNLTTYRFFPRLNSRFECGLMLIENYMNGKVNTQELQDFKMTQISYFFKYGSAFKGRFNLRYQAQWTNGISKQKTLFLQNNNFFSTAEMVIKPIKAIFLKLEFFQIGNRIPGDSWQFSLGGKGRIEFEVQPWRSNFSISGMNITGLKAIRQVQNETFSQHSTALIAAAPFIIVNWGYTF
jgi:hypothetical protein